MTRDVSLLIWVVLAIALVGCQLVATLSHGSRLGVVGLVRIVSASFVVRVLLALGWMWLGWHAFAR